MKNNYNYFALTNEALVGIVIALVFGMVLAIAVKQRSIKTIKFKDAEVEFLPEQAEQPGRLPYR